MEEIFEDKRELGKEVFWNCIVITCSDPKWRNHTEKEANQLARAGLLPPHDLLLVVDDPQPSVSSTIQGSHSYGVGSGGATLNALLIVTERLSALAGDTTINSDVLSKNLILMVHFGRSSFHYPGANAFLPIDPSSSWVPPSICNPTPPVLLQHSMWMASVLASRSSTGVWITSLDFFIPYVSTISVPSTASLEGALVCSLKLENLLDRSSEHGFLDCSSDGGLQEISYKSIPACEDIGQDKRIICGSTFLSSSLAEKFLSFYTLSPLDRCTYYGTDSSTEPVQVSLYFDLLLPLCSNTNKDRYLSGELGSSYAKRAKYSTLMHQEGVRARYNIWNQLRSHIAFEHQLNIGSSSYLNPALPFSSTLEPSMKHFETYSDSFASLFPTRNVSNCNSRFDCSFNPDPSRKLTVINCLLGPELSLEASGECVLSDLRLPDATFLSLNLGRRIVWQRWPLRSDEGCYVTTCHGFDDRMTVDMRSEETFTLFNRSWSEFSSYFNLAPSDIWDQDECHSVIKAKLFPSDLSLTEQLMSLEVIVVSTDDTDDEHRREVVQRWKNSSRKSFEDILKLFDVERMLREREDTFVTLVKRLIKDTSKRMTGPSLLPIFKYVTSISTERSLVLLEFFHEVLQDFSPTSSRLLANVADLLGCLGGVHGGLRSGPAANKKWIPALVALKEGDYQDGIKQLEKVCKEFIKSGRPDDIIRASRHYERASHILISKQVETARNQVFPLSYEGASPKPIKKGVWVEASCPARLDLAGGWTDTPPVCYELGGAVLNVAIKVNGRRPIGAKARITEDLNLVCVLKDSSKAELKLVWEKSSDLNDYNNPVSSGALVKACLVYAKFIDLKENTKTLQDQLQDRYNGGLELIVWSELAQGSGLGGSSLLAGTILGVIFVLMGFDPPPTHKLIHATLSIEQMLTTGGGWQDQVGGLVGGLKLGISYRNIPLVVDTFSIPVNKEFLQFLNERLILIYTGKVRLARNLVQTVLRNWYAREKNVTSCFHALRELALDAAGAAMDEDSKKLGKCVDRYWELKKMVASGCEPVKVSELMSSIRSSMLGQSLAGAGCGGYLYGLTSTQLLDVNSDAVEVDVEGLKISVNGVCVMVTQCHGKELTPHSLRQLRQQFEEDSH